MPEDRSNPVKGCKTGQEDAKNICVRDDMRVAEIIALCPEAADIMAEYGLHCFSCALGGAETLAEGTRMHGFDDEKLAELLDDINRAIADAPERPQVVALTADAAQGIRDIAKAEGHEGEGLSVIVDSQGGFSLEFSPEPGSSDAVFFHEEELDVRIFVEPLTLRRIGGATIDFRDGRFKLDLPGEKLCEGKCDHAKCACGK